MRIRSASSPLETTIDLGGRSVPLTARVNRRARRLIVTVDSVAGRVIVTAPSKRALPEALDFAKAKSPWILRQLSENAAARPFHDGLVFPLRGAAITVVNSGPARSGVRLEGSELIAGGEARHLNRRITDWLKAEARRALTERSDHYASLVGRRRGPITIRDTRSRWGSCTREGALSFSWRLILAPLPILDYVAAHECAHLVHLDHSPAFWRLLKSLDVDAKAARRWFSENGQDLYAYGARRAHV